MPTKRAASKDEASGERRRGVVHRLTPLASALPENEGPIESAPWGAPEPSWAVEPHARQVRDRPKVKRLWELRSRIGHHYRFFSSLRLLRTKGPIRERRRSGSKPEARQSRCPPSDVIGGKKTSGARELRSRVGLPPAAFSSALPGKRRAPSRAPKERLEPKARQSHAHQVSGRQKARWWELRRGIGHHLTLFRSLARKRTRARLGAPKERLEPKASVKSPQPAGASDREKDKHSGSWRSFGLVTA